LTRIPGGTRRGGGVVDRVKILNPRYPVYSPIQCICRRDFAKKAITGRTIEASLEETEVGGDAVNQGEER
jgi:hypothetical protein